MNGIRNDRRLILQLTFVPVKRVLHEGSNPTPQEIAQMTGEFRKTWDDDTERKRRTGSAHYRPQQLCPIDTMPIRAAIPMPDETEY